jgi:hypothetical protein
MRSRSQSKNAYITTIAHALPVAIYLKMRGEAAKVVIGTAISALRSLLWDIKLLRINHAENRAVLFN